MGTTTIERSVALLRLDPERFQQVKEGSISGHAALKEARLRERTRHLATFSRASRLPDRKFPVILADPPWTYTNTPESETRRVENHYPTMRLEAIKRLPVSSLATEDAVLFLWTTSSLLPEAMSVVSALGFEYKTCAVWVKDRLGMGYFFRQKHELLLVATRGQMPKPLPSRRPASVVMAPRGGHSERPEAVYAVIEKMYPALPRLELFARCKRPGWTAWGNEVPARG